MGAPIPKDPSGVLELLLNRFQTNEETISFTPEKLFSIISEANNGSNFRQSKLAEEILEKDPDIASAFEMRIAAIAGAKWSIRPVGSKDEADEGAVKIKQALKAIPGNPFIGELNFQQWIKAQSLSAITGFGMAWTNWAPGGQIAGFLHLAPHNFTFWKSPYLPRLRVVGDQFQGLPVTSVEPDKGPGGEKLLNPDFSQWIYHRHYMDFRDVARAGLIRPLCYMYAFNNLNKKDMLRFREKFGMPFMLIQMANMFDETRGTLTAEAQAARALLQNLGTDAGLLVSKNMDVSPTQPGNVEGSIFFKSDETYKREVGKLLLGQTSSQDSTNSNRSTAQVHNAVRNDILVADTDAIASTANQQIIPQVTAFELGPEAGPYEMVFNTTVPTDQKLIAESIERLKKGGVRPTENGLTKLATDFGDLELEIIPTEEMNNGTN